MSVMFNRWQGTAFLSKTYARASVNLMEDRNICLFEGAPAPSKPWRGDISSSKVPERWQGHYMKKMSPLQERHSKKG